MFFQRGLLAFTTKPYVSFSSLQTDLTFVLLITSFNLHRPRFFSRRMLHLSACDLLTFRDLRGRLGVWGRMPWHLWRCLSLKESTGRGCGAGGGGGLRAFSLCGGGRSGWGCSFESGCSESSSGRSGSDPGDSCGCVLDSASVAGKADDGGRAAVPAGRWRRAPAGGRRPSGSEAPGGGRRLS